METKDIKLHMFLWTLTMKILMGYMSKCGAIMKSLIKRCSDSQVIQNRIANSWELRINLVRWSKP